MPAVAYGDVYDAAQTRLEDAREMNAPSMAQQSLEMPALRGFMFAADNDELMRQRAVETGVMGSHSEEMDGMRRMQNCRIALDALDRAGWKGHISSESFTMPSWRRARGRFSNWTPRGRSSGRTRPF